MRDQTHWITRDDYVLFPFFFGSISVPFCQPYVVAITGYVLLCAFFLQIWYPPHRKSDQIRKHYHPPPFSEKENKGDKKRTCQQYQGYMAEKTLKKRTKKEPKENQKGPRFLILFVSA